MAGMYLSGYVIIGCFYSACVWSQKSPKLGGSPTPPTQCLTDEFFCSGARKCMSNAEKENCQPGEGLRTCPNGEFFCPASRECLSVAERENCQPGEDELGHCRNGEFFCKSSETCTSEAERSNCQSDVDDPGSCSAGQFFCKSSKRCLSEAERSSCQSDVEEPSGCLEGQFFCKSSKTCLSEAERSACQPDVEKPTSCPERHKRCEHECIAEKATCECAEGMSYCESLQHCMPEERLKDGFECPEKCTVEGERYCPFRNTCIPRDQLCHCPKDKPRACATKKGCLGPKEECPCPDGHSYCENTWSCVPDNETCPSCENGEKYCAFEGGCVPKNQTCGCGAGTKYCPYRRTPGIRACVNETKDEECSCPDSMKPCLTLLKCIPRWKSCPCRRGEEYCESNGECSKDHCPHKGCPSGQFFCEKLEKCMIVEMRSLCPMSGSGEHEGCPKGKKRCEHECIAEKATCECAEGMAYCESLQHCMPEERLKDGFECPEKCTVEGERYCPFRNTCIPRDQLCHCPEGKPRACATKKGCLGPKEECPCPDGHSYCENTWSCVPDNETCPSCENGEKYCAFEGGCVPKNQTCGCGAGTKYCPYRRTPGIRACVNETKDEECSCPDSMKPCLTLLKCIPRWKSCPCRRGEEYCESNGECSKDHCPHKGCPSGQFFCEKLEKCMSVEMRSLCPMSGSGEHEGCPKGKKRCEHECIAEKATCECAEGMAYCESLQHCMPEERLKDGFECPEKCTVEGERYCLFRNTCIPHDQFCHCPKDKPFFCNSSKTCLSEAERSNCQYNEEEPSHCPAGKIPCPSATGTKCIPETEQCDCAQDMGYCETRRQCMPKEILKNPDKCPPRCRPGQEGCTVEPKPGSPKEGDYFFGGTIFANIPDQRNYVKALADVFAADAGASEVTVEGTLDKVSGSWQVSVARPGNVEPQWKDVNEGMAIRRGALLRFKPRDHHVHGLDGIELKIGEVSKYIGILVMPCVLPTLKIKRKLAGTEDMPLNFDLDDVIQLSRVREGSSEPNVEEKYEDLIPEHKLEWYKRLLSQTLGKNLGIRVGWSRRGHIEQDPAVQPGVEKRDKFTAVNPKRLTEYQSTVFRQGSKLVFKPAEDHFGEILLNVTPVDESPNTEESRSVSDLCDAGLASNLSIEIANVNDQPSAVRDRRGKPVLIVGAPPLPYELDKHSDNAGFSIGDFTKRVGTDKDQDKMGIAVVKALRTKIGNWQYQASEGNQSWTDIILDGKIDDRGFIVASGGNAQLLFLPADHKLRFRPLELTTLWDENEAIDYTAFQFVLWDQSDERQAGVHSVTTKGNMAISLEVLSCFIGRFGCDRKVNSKKKSNECNQCGEKSCKKCDGGLNSTAVINECGFCTLGSTSFGRDHGMNCKGTCSEKYVMDKKCQRCRGKDEVLVDCNGKCDGRARVNHCGKCSEDVNAGVDACGVCDGDGSSCKGCDGVANSGKVPNMCGECRSPKATDFNAGCVSIGKVSPKAFPKGVRQTLSVTGAGLKGRDIECDLWSGQTKIKASKITVENDETLKITIPGVNGAGKHNVSCTISGRVYTSEKSTVAVYDKEQVRVTKVEPAEIDVGSAVTEVVVSGTGFMDTGDVSCVYEAQGKTVKGKSVRKPAKFIAEEEVACPVEKVSRALGVEMSVVLSKADTPDSSVRLAWYAKAPEVSGQIFDDRLESIVIKFDRSVKPLQSANRLGTVGCEDLLTRQTMVKLQELAQEEIKCRFKSKMELHIDIPGAEIEAETLLEFKPDVIRADEAFSRSSSPRVIVTPPAETTLPVPVITAPHRVGLCDRIKLSGLNSKNTGRKKFQCSWSVSVPDEAALNGDARTDLASVRDLINTTACRLEVPSANLRQGIRYTFRLELLIRGKAKGNATSQDIERSDLNVPSVTFSTQRKVFDMSKSRFVIKATARKPKCVGKSVIMFRWSCEGLDLRDNERNKLRLLSKSLDCDTNYEFNLRAYMATNPDLKVDLVYPLKTKSAPLKFQITGGDRVIASSSKIKLDVRPTAKVSCGGNLKYLFSCTGEDGLGCLVTDADGNREPLKFESINSPRVSLKANQFEANRVYTFKVEVSKGTQNVETSTRITIRPGNPPNVRIHPPKKRSSTISVVGIISSASNGTSYKWLSVVEEGYSFVDFDKLKETSGEKVLYKGKTSGTFGKPDDKDGEYFKRVAITFAHEALEPDLSYKLKLTAWSDEAPEEIGESEITIKRNSPPSQGELVVEPPEGVAHNTTFSLSAVGFVDDSPVSCKFYYEKRGKRGVRRHSLPLSDGQWSLDAQLPPGSEEGNGSLSLVVVAQDADGATAEAKRTVSIIREQLSKDDLEKQASEIENMVDDGDRKGALKKSNSVSSSFPSAEDTPEIREQLSEMRRKEIEMAKEITEDLLSNGQEGVTVDDEEIKELLSMFVKLEPPDDDSKKVLSNTVSGLSKKMVPTDGQQSVLPIRGETVTRRQRRSAGTETTRNEEEASGMTSDQVEDVLDLFEKLIDTSVVNNITRDFLQTVDNLLVSMCETLQLGDSSQALSSLGVLKSDMNYMDDVDKMFHEVSCTNCSDFLDETALVKFGSRLKSLFNEWNCSSEDEPCNGVCVAMVQYPHDFITADNSSTRRSDVVFIDFKNPETFDYIPVKSLTNPVVLRIPLHAGSSKSGEYECTIWDSSIPRWSTSGCQKTSILLQNGTVYVDCSCSRLGFITVHAVEETAQTQTDLTTELTTAESAIETSKQATEASEGQRLAVHVTFSFDVDYHIIVVDATAKIELLNALVAELANVMNVDISMIVNVTVIKGSIVVDFVVLCPEQNSALALNQSITRLQTAVNGGQFTVVLSNGVQITADNGTLVYSYKYVRDTSSLVTELPVLEDDDAGHLPLVLGCIFGVLLLLVIIVVVFYRRHLIPKTKVSHENIRSSQPIKNNCIQNAGFQGSTGGNVHRPVTSGKGAPHTTGLEPERPLSASSRVSIRQAAELPSVE